MAKTRTRRDGTDGRGGDSRRGRRRTNYADGQVGGTEGLGMGVSPYPIIDHLSSQNSYTPTDSETWQYNADMRRYRNEMNGDGDSGGGGGYITPTTVTYGPKPIKGGIQTPSSGLPWWKPLTYQGGGAAEILASSANALIPSLGGDEQANIAKWLGTNFSDFSSYSSLPSSSSGAMDAAAMRAKMFSKTRAQQAIDSLEMMRKASGATEEQMGAGYSFLKKTASLLDKYSGEGGISRSNYIQMQSEFNSMLGGIEDSYQELGRAMLNPSVGGNPLMQSIRTNGRDSFGVANTKLFT